MKKTNNNPFPIEVDAGIPSRRRIKRTHTLTTSITLAFVESLAAWNPLERLVYNVPRGAGETVIQQIFTQHVGTWKSLEIWRLLVKSCYCELSRFHAHTKSFTVYDTKNHKHMESRQVNFEESLPILTGRHTHMHMLARASSRLYKLGNVTSSPFWYKWTKWYHASWICEL